MTHFDLQKRIINQSGFTLIETLVAIAILLVAVASPLIVSQRGIAAAASAKEQMIAYYLAQDAMEQIRAVRDDNGLKSPKNYWLEEIYLCGVDDPCTIDIYGDSANRIQQSSVNSGPLKFDPVDHYYLYNTTGPDTPFRRVFYLTPDTLNNGEVLVTVKVMWSSGGSGRQVIIQSRLFDIR